MRKTLTPQASSQSTFRRASTEVTRLLIQLTDQNQAELDISRARAGLEALPIAADEFLQALNRLRNAQVYSHACEHGASRYELQMLVKSLNNQRQRYA